MKLASTPPALRHLVDALDELSRADRLRERFPSPAVSGALVAPSFCSNDYLGLAAEQAHGSRSGSGASRLVGGDDPEHRSLETELSTWLGTSTALTFTSGYAANVGTVAALADRNDLIVSDALNHASLIDGARLSRARVVVTPHNDVDAVRRALADRRERRAWVITESYFSMDADGPDLAALRAVCDEADAALVVDEAHALGVMGPDGRGRCAEAGIQPDVLIGTFGKSLGSGGAFVAGCDALILWLWNRARSFVFSTGLSPTLAAVARVHLERLRSQPALAERVRRNATFLRRGLADLGRPALGFGHIVPVVLGTEANALGAAAALRQRGFAVQAIRPPTVPVGTARLRLTTTALHQPAHIEAFVTALGQLVAAGHL